MIFSVVTLADDVSRTLLGLEVNLADIFTDNTDAHHLDSAQEADDARCARPDLRGASEEMRYQCIDKEHKAYEGYDEAEPCDYLDGLDGEARNTVESEREQLRDGVMPLACETLVSVVVDTCALEADQGEETS